MREPTTSEEWLDVARERAKDALSMLPDRSNSVGPAYVAGYAVESALKAYLQKQQIPRPAFGPAGHDLRALWKTAGFQLRDLQDPDGYASFFVESWTTALRYQAAPPPPCHDPEKLVASAKRLVQWIASLTKRKQRRRKR